jgi:thiol:disulfide interchange protein DsbD
MKKTTPILVVLALAGMFISLPSWASTVRVGVIHSQDRYRAGGSYPLLFRLAIPKDLNIHGTKEGDDLIPTTLSFPDHPELRMQGIQFPEPEKKRFAYATGPVETYSGDVLVRATLVVRGDAETGPKFLKGLLSYQACTSNACLPPQNTPVTVSLSVVPEGSPARALNRGMFLALEKGKDDPNSLPGVKPGAGLWIILLGTFLGGLALNLTPCIYPLIPVTVSYFSGKSGRLRGHALFHSLLYIAGLALTNSMLGLSAALTGGLLGSALQHPIVLILAAGILLALGLSFFGFWEIRLPPGLNRFAARHYGGFFGSFFMGLTLGILAAPCIGPFLLGLLTYVGQKGDPFLGFLCFFTLSIGMGLPLAFLAFCCSATDRLPMSGDWMIWVRKFMGWVLLGMSAYIVSPLIPHDLVKSGLLAALAILAGIHLGWVDRTARSHRVFPHLKRGLGILLIGGAVIYLLASGYQKEEISWIPYDEGLISTAAKEKRPLILDFTAKWCNPCRAMDREVFADREVIEMTREFITMRLDLTTRRPFQDEILKRYRVRGVPTIIFFNKEGIEEDTLRIESYVGKDQFLDRVKQLLEKSPPLQK